MTPWPVARLASLSMGFTSKGTRVGCHFLLQGIVSTQELKAALAGGFFTSVPPGKPGFQISLLQFLFFHQGKLVNYMEKQEKANYKVQMDTLGWVCGSGQEWRLRRSYGASKALVEIFKLGVMCKLIHFY